MSRAAALRRLAAVGAVVAALALLLLLWPTLGLSAESRGEAGALRVERDDLVVSVEVTGTLQSTDSQLLGPPAVPNMWNYKISFMAPEGADVKAGTPVLRFDATEMTQRLQEKIAERDSAATELDKRRVDLDRELRQMELDLAEAEARLRKADLKVDVPEGLQSAKELAEAKLDRQVAQDEVDSLRQRLALKEKAGGAAIQALREKRQRADERVAEIQEYIQRLNVAAPRDGTVIYTTDWRGNKMKVGDDVWQARKVMEIPDLTRMQGEGFVDEADAGRLAVGQPVHLRLDAHPETEYRGTVAEIANAVTRQERGNPLKHVQLTISLAQTDPQRMRPGMRFQGEVEVERAEDVLLAPAVAVRSTADGPVAYRRGFFGAHPVTVEVGRRNERWVEILSGLAEGDELVLPQEEG
jgi:multidrug resistance efflux pump